MGRSNKTLYSICSIRMQHWVQSKKSENVTTTEYKYFQIEISRIFAKVAKVMQPLFFFCILIQLQLTQLHSPGHADKKKTSKPHKLDILHLSVYGGGVRGSRCVVTHWLRMTQPEAKFNLNRDITWFWMLLFYADASLHSQRSYHHLTIKTKSWRIENWIKKFLNRNLCSQIFLINILRPILKAE